MQGLYATKHSANGRRWIEQDPRSQISSEKKESLMRLMRLFEKKRDVSRVSLVQNDYYVDMERRLSEVWSWCAYLLARF